MRTVYKYQLATTDLQEIQLPKNSKIISTQVQHGEIVLYAEVNTKEEDTELRHIRICGTGQPLLIEWISEKPIKHLHFIGTVQLMHGALVFHIYEAIF